MTHVGSIITPYPDLSINRDMYYVAAGFTAADLNLVCMYCGTEVSPTVVIYEDSEAKYNCPCCDAFYSVFLFPLVFPISGETPESSDHICFDCAPYEDRQKYLTRQTSHHLVIVPTEAVMSDTARSLEFIKDDLGPMLPGINLSFGGDD